MDERKINGKDRCEKDQEKRQRQKKTKKTEMFKKLKDATDIWKKREITEIQSSVKQNDGCKK